MSKMFFTVESTNRGSCLVHADATQNLNDTVRRLKEIYFRTKIFESDRELNSASVDTLSRALKQDIFHS